jgi:hypothetical protein
MDKDYEKWLISEHSTGRPPPFSRDSNKQCNSPPTRMSPTFQPKVATVEELVDDLRLHRLDDYHRGDIPCSRKRKRQRLDDGTTAIGTILDAECVTFIPNSSSTVSLLRSGVDAAGRDLLNNRLPFRGVGLDKASPYPASPSKQLSNSSIIKSPHGTPSKQPSHRTLPIRFPHATQRPPIAPGLSEFSAPALNEYNPPIPPKSQVYCSLVTLSLPSINSFVLEMD